MSAGPVRPVATIPGASGADVERAVNALAGRDVARERTRPGPLPPLAPLPASVGVAEWGVTQAVGGV